MPSLTIGSNGDDHLTMQIAQMKEADWIIVKFDVVSGNFRGTLITDDFLVGYFFSLRSEFERLYHELSGEMKFETLEHRIKWQISGNGRGNFDFWCCLNYQIIPAPCYIEFAFDFDQTYIPRFLREFRRNHRSRHARENERKLNLRIDSHAPNSHCLSPR